MSLTYLSGEEIRAGDRILYHGEPGRVEFVAIRGERGPVWDSVIEWYIEQFGGWEAPATDSRISGLSGGKRGSLEEIYNSYSAAAFRRC